MKKIITPLVGPKGRKEILLRLEKLEERVSLLENAPTNEEEQEVVVEDEFTPIQIATNCYIKSTDFEVFVDDIIGTHVYSNESCTTPAEDEEYSYRGVGLSEYAEENELELNIPEIVSFITENGVIINYTDELVPEDIEEPIEMGGAILLGYLSTDSSKEAYVDANVSEEIEGEKAYSDDTLSEYAVAGHYIGATDGVGQFDVDSNGTISNLTDPEPEEEQGPVEEELPAEEPEE